MSHIVTVQVEIKDLEAVRRMCANLGWEFLEGQTSFVWYGRDPAKCDHAIRVPGCDYELGLEKHEDAYKLLWDPFDNQLAQAMGGKGGERFAQEYGLAAVTLEAERNGYTWHSTRLDNGSYEVEVNTY